MTIRWLCTILVAASCASPEGLVSDRAIRWTATLAGNGSRTPSALAVDETGVFVTGHFTGTLANTASERPNGFVARFERDGTVSWTRVLASPTEASIESVLVTGSMVVVGGNYRGAASLGGASLPVNDEPRQGFIAALSRTSGEVRWVRNVSTWGITSVGALTSIDGDIVLAGTAGSYAESWAQVARMRSIDGEVRWVRPIRAVGDDDALPFAEVSSIAVDRDDNIVAAGTYTGRGLAPFGPWPSLAFQSAFVAWLDQRGTPQRVRTNVLRKDHEGHGGHRHDGLIDRVMFLRTYTDAVVLGGLQFETLAHEGAATVPWASRAVLIDLASLEVLADVQDETLVALAADASRSGAPDRFVTSTPGNPFGSTPGGSRESATVLDLASVRQQRALAWIEDAAFHLRAVATARVDSGQLVLLQKQAALQLDDGGPSEPCSLELVELAL